MSELRETNVSHLSYTFKTSQGPLDVLQDVSLSVRVGEVISILGPSGCGKSTLLKCIAGLISVGNGTVEVAGMSPSEALASKSVGFAFQDPALLAWRNVEQNIMLPAQLGLLDGRDRGRYDQRLDWLLSLTGLTAFKTFLPEKLSGGMKQRVSLARALLLEPKLLLLDEPLGSLDLLTRTNLGAELDRILYAMKVPTIIVTHSVEEAIFLGTRVVILSARPARIIDDVISDFPKPRVLSLLEQTQFLKVVAHCRSLLLDAWTQV